MYYYIKYFGNERTIENENAKSVTFVKNIILLEDFNYNWIYINYDEFIAYYKPISQNFVEQI